MSKSRRRRYDAQFKKDAIALANDQVETLQKWNNPLGFPMDLLAVGAGNLKNKVA